MTLALSGRRLKQYVNNSEHFWRSLGTAGDTGLYRTASRCANCSDTHVNLLLTKQEELVMDVNNSVSLGCCDHEISGSDLPRARRIADFCIGFACQGFVSGVPQGQLL